MKVINHFCKEMYVVVVVVVAACLGFVVLLAFNFFTRVRQSNVQDLVRNLFNLTDKKIY